MGDHLRSDRVQPFITREKRFKETNKNRITIFTGQDPVSGHLYIVKDDKTNLGPGCYRDQYEIEQARSQYKNLIQQNRRVDIFGSPGGFSSTSARDAGSSINAQAHNNSYPGKIAFHEKRHSSVCKPTFNTKFRKEMHHRNAQNLMGIGKKRNSTLI